MSAFAARTWLVNLFDQIFKAPAKVLVNLRRGTAKTRLLCRSYTQSRWRSSWCAVRTIWDSRNPKLEPSVPPLDAIRAIRIDTYNRLCARARAREIIEEFLLEFLTRITRKVVRLFFLPRISSGDGINLYYSRS
jgi:hypothetical protein